MVEPSLDSAIAAIPILRIQHPIDLLPHEPSSVMPVDAAHKKIVIRCFGMTDTRYELVCKGVRFALTRKTLGPIIG
jgi:hypothetical protein